MIGMNLVGRIYECFDVTVSLFFYQIFDMISMGHLKIGICFAKKKFNKT
jgi:hypothetical protein